MKKSNVWVKVIVGSFLSLLLVCAFIFATAWFSHRVEQPLGGILTALTVLVYLGGLYLIRRRVKKRAVAEAKEKTGVLVPDGLHDGSEEPELEVIRIFGFKPNRIYRLSQSEGQYRFIYAGKELMGAVSDASEEKENFSLRWSDITAWKLSFRPDGNTPLTSCGIVTFQTTGEYKKLRLVILGEVDEREILSFFSAIRGKLIEGKHADRKQARKERDVEYGA